jgi:predicted KAP-like P-loop ATPase
MVDNEASGYPELQILTDRPLIRDNDDYLGFGPYADALALILDNPETYTPLTLAISAPWGAGKTSLANMVEKRLATWPADRGNFDHIICWFNAWMHDDAPHLGSAFAAEVAKTVSRARPWWRRLLNPVPSAMLSPEERWLRRVKIGIFCVAIIVMAILTPSISDLLTAAFTPTKADVEKLKASLGVDQYSRALLLIVAFAAWKKFFTTAQAVARFIDDPKSEAAKGAMQQVRTQLARLIRQATRGRRRLVIFVDDLERCRPPRSIEVCEVASQLLGHKDVATVLIADMSTVATSAQIKYSALEVPSITDDSTHSPSSDRRSYGRSYLQKIVQLQFDLPAPQPRDVERMMTSPFNTETSLSRRHKGNLSVGVRSLVR